MTCQGSVKDIKPCSTTTHPGMSSHMYGQNNQ